MALPSWQLNDILILASPSVTSHNRRVVLLVVSIATLLLLATTDILLKADPLSVGPFGTTSPRYSRGGRGSIYLDISFEGQWRIGSAALVPRASRRSLSPSRRVDVSSPLTALIWRRLDNIILAMFSVAIYTTLLLISIAILTTLAEWPYTITSATGLVSASG